MALQYNTIHLTSVIWSWKLVSHFKDSYHTCICLFLWKRQTSRPMETHNTPFLPCGNPHLLKPHAITGTMTRCTLGRKTLEARNTPMSLALQVRWRPLRVEIGNGLELYVPSIAHAHVKHSTSAETACFTAFFDTGFMTIWLKRDSHGKQDQRLYICSNLGWLKQLLNITYFPTGI